MSTREKVYILIAEGKNNKEIAEKLNIKLRTVQHYSKEYREGKTQTQKHNKDAKKNANAKICKEKAKALIITGATLSETAEETGTNRSTLGNWSSKEKLQETQAEFLKRLRDKYIEDIEQNKADRLTQNKKIKERITERIDAVEIIDKDTQKLIKLNEETEQAILESDRLIQLEKLEIERQKVLNESNESDKLDDILNKLDESLGSD